MYVFFSIFINVSLFLFDVLLFMFQNTLNQIQFKVIALINKQLLSSRSGIWSKIIIIKTLLIPQSNLIDFSFNHFIVFCACIVHSNKISVIKLSYNKHFTFKKKNIIKCFCQKGVRQDKNLKRNHKHQYQHKILLPWHWIDQIFNFIV